MKFNKNFKDEIKKEDFNYCSKQWEEFTALTEQERFNLNKIGNYVSKINLARKKALEAAKKTYKEIFNKMLSANKPKKDGRAKNVYDKTADIFYSSQKECAKALGVSIAWVARCIKDGYKAKGHILIEVDCGR